MSTTVVNPGTPNTEEESRDQFATPRTAAQLQAAKARINAVSFKFKDAPMPTALYVTPDDKVALYVNNLAIGVRLLLDIRFMGMDGRIVPLQYTVIPSNDGSLTFFNTGLQEGFILSLSIGNIGNGAKRGSCFATCTLWRNGVTVVDSYQVLFARYIEANPIAGWPYPSIQSPTEGPGFMQQISGTLPAAGAEISETTPPRTIWRIVAFSFQLATAVGGSFRSIELRIDNGFFIEVRTVPNVAPSGAANSLFSAASGFPSPGGAGVSGFNNFSFIPLPFNTLMRPGSRIGTFTGGLQAGDQYSAPQYLVETWVEP